MTRRFRSTLALGTCSAALAALVLSPAAQAADMPAKVVAAPAPVLTGLFDGIEYHAQGEVGILGNTLNPSQGAIGQGYNFGQLYTDHANEAQLNQILLTITKPVDPKATGYAFGFTLQGLYGSDMRFNHFLGIGDQFMGSQRDQLNVVQGFVAAHLPIFTSGGVDLKIGLFTSPQGYETLDPSTSPFYSHSYTYNYAVTFNHTGVLSTTHVNDKFDLYLGVDTGNQTSIGYPGGDPNGQIAGFVGFGLNNLLNDKLTVLALSHIGPEQNFVTDPTGASKDLRYYNDVVFTYKATDALTSVTELNYTRDDFGLGIGAGPAESFSVAQYFGYTFGKIFTLNFRGEVLRDTQNFFVSTPQDNSAIAKLEHGNGTVPFPLIAPNLTAFNLGNNPTQGTTYGAITLGLTIKPDVPKPLALVLLRPEIRYDRVVAGTKAFNNNVGLGGFNTGSRDQFTFGGDLVIGF